MRDTRLVAYLFLSVTVLLVVAPLGAQRISISAGPAMRFLERDTQGPGMPGVGVDAGVAIRLGPSLRLLVGAGIVIENDQSVYAPLPPGATPCGCYASDELRQARVGLALERGAFRFGLGGVVADAGAGEPARLGGFAEVRAQPIHALPFLDIGVLGVRLAQPTGRHRGIVMPTIGLRF